ncbi:hypothetical protein QYE76_043930 [Lolium multiflorum]|uniref:Retrotransposon gag domain-containing protein n=1 Tax=Lolium multiflorum TaxID=4521 RepID=A0AAD8TJP9_LOLMU|nr:hypothetical protein QYE76_043930 [Lolium multiflorum]
MPDTRREKTVSATSPEEPPEEQHIIRSTSPTTQEIQGTEETETARLVLAGEQENSASNRDSDYTIADEEWAAARAVEPDSSNAVLAALLKGLSASLVRGLPKGSIKSWDDLVDAFVANFQATYKRLVGIEDLRNCQQKQEESMRSYIGRFTKLLNAAEDVSVDRAIDAFSDGVRRESYIEELGRKKAKTITKLMEIANSWADGEDNVRRPRRSDDEDDDQPKHDLGSRRDRHKRRKNRNYDDNNQ